MKQREIMVAPSLLSADFSCMQQGLSLIEKSGGDIVHLDIMDGNFVPNITFGPKMVKDLRSKTELPLDVHLMINDPAAYIDDFIDAGADYLTFHYEATPHVDRLIQRINNRGIKAGLSLVPSTPVELIKNLLPYLDLIL